MCKKQKQNIIRTEIFLQLEGEFSKVTLSHKRLEIFKES